MLLTWRRRRARASKWHSAFEEPAELADEAGLLWVRLVPDLLGELGDELALSATDLLWNFHDDGDALIALALPALHGNSLATKPEYFA